MISRARVVNQKRSALKKQFTSISSALTGNTLDKTNATLRLTRLTEWFHAYEELHDELEIADPDNEALGHMTEISDEFYELAARITSMPTPGGSRSSISMGGSAPIASSTFLEKQRRLKLPTANIPKFNGDCEKWVGFRNLFKSMVDSLTDVDDQVKFVYLRDALEGEAANKIAIFDATAENYKNAWKSLVDAYDRKRILIAKHMDALLDTPAVDIATASNLSKLVDDTRQRLVVLKSMDATPDDKIVVRILERALPIDIRGKWEDSLQLDAFPQLDEFYKFISTTIYRLTTMESETMRIKGEKGVKRPAEKEMHVNKKHKGEPTARALLTPTRTKGCPRCGKSHHLYGCPEHQKATVAERWAFVGEKRLCQNCLRNHRGGCNSGDCRKCKQSHHTSLHRDEKSKPENPQV